MGRRRSPLHSRRCCGSLASAMRQSPTTSDTMRLIVAGAGRVDPAGRQSGHTAPPEGTANAACRPGVPQIGALLQRRRPPRARHRPKQIRVEHERAGVLRGRQRPYGPQRQLEQPQRRLMLLRRQTAPPSRRPRSPPCSADSRAELLAVQLDALGLPDRVQATGAGCRALRPAARRRARTAQPGPEARRRPPHSLGRRPYPAVLAGEQRDDAVRTRPASVRAERARHRGTGWADGHPPSCHPPAPTSSAAPPPHPHPPAPRAHRQLRRVVAAQRPKDFSAAPATQIAMIEVLSAVVDLRSRGYVLDHPDLGRGHGGARRRGAGRGRGTAPGGGGGGRAARGWVRSRGGGVVWGRLPFFGYADVEIEVDAGAEELLDRGAGAGCRRRAARAAGAMTMAFWEGRST